MASCHVAEVFDFLHLACPKWLYSETEKANALILSQNDALARKVPCRIVSGRGYVLKKLIPGMYSMAGFVILVPCNLRDTNTMKTLLKLSLGTVLAAGTLSAEAGPIGTYYLTDYVANKLQAIQGDTIMSNAEGDQYEGPIAIVGSSIRTTSIHFSAAGSEYVSAPDLSVTLTGNAYANSIGDAIYDGTTDGSHNYTVSFENNTVYRTNTDWSNPVALFTLSTPFYIGITYDNSNNSLWLSNFNYGLIIDVAMDGTVLSSFTMATSTLTSALAMDLDHTLWLDAYDDSGNLLHYATDGTYLGSEHYSGLRYALGGEIMAAPEPASLALFGVGAMGLLRRYRKNQKA